jgi:hypothetical protein
MNTWSTRSRIIAMMAAAAAGFGVALCSAQANQVLDFEDPGLGQADDMAFTNQYEAQHGIVFGIDNDGDLAPDDDATPYLEAQGEDGTDAFGSTYWNVNDTARDDRPQTLGQWFLRAPGHVGDPGVTDSLLIRYVGDLTRQASGQLWDIDGSNNRQEQWLVTAYGQDESPIASIQSPLGTTADPNLNQYESGAWRWTFDLPPDDPEIAFVRIDYIGTGTPGFAFDNFYAFDVPAPGTAALLGLAGMTQARRRRR